MALRPFPLGVWSMCYNLDQCSDPLSDKLLLSQHETPLIVWLPRGIAQYWVRRPEPPIIECQLDAPMRLV